MLSDLTPDERTELRFALTARRAVYATATDSDRDEAKRKRELIDGLLEKLGAT